MKKNFKCLGLVLDNLYCLYIVKETFMYYNVVR